MASTVDDILLEECLKGQMSRFNIYAALKCLPGKSVSSMNKVMMKEGFRITPNELKRCVAKATKTGVMKRTKKGYRVEVRICDNLIKSLFRKFLQEPSILGVDTNYGTLNGVKWQACGAGPVCQRHTQSIANGNLRRGSSLLCVLGDSLTKSMSFFKKTIKRKSSFNQLNEADDISGPNTSLSEVNENVSPPLNKRHRSNEEEEQPQENHVLIDCWKGVTHFFKNLETSNMIPSESKAPN